MSVLVSKIRREKNLKSKKVYNFKTHHKIVVTISPPDLKTNTCILYWDFLTMVLAPLGVEIQ